MEPNQRERYEQAFKAGDAQAFARLCRTMGYDPSQAEPDSPHARMYNDGISAIMEAERAEDREDMRALYVRGPARGVTFRKHSTRAKVRKPSVRAQPRPFTADAVPLKRKGESDREYNEGCWEAFGNK